MGNKNPEHDSFEVGDDVMFMPTGSYGEIRGVVHKVTPSRVTIAKSGDGETHVLHRSKWGRPFRCRRVGAVDRAREAWKATTAAWEQARPTLQRLSLSRWDRNSDFHVHLDGRVLATPEVMQEIADEANAIREWLRKRPEEPK
jgi:hypothetical protein